MTSGTTWTTTGNTPMTTANTPMTTGNAPLTATPRSRTLHEVITRQAALRPDQPAVVCSGRTLTYRELDRESERTARVLRASGAGPGSRVGYLGKEAVEYWELAFACARTGAVLVPVNWRLTAQEVDHILRDSTTEVLFVDEEHLPVAAEVRKGLPTLRTVLCLDAHAPDAESLAARKSALSAATTAEASGGGTTDGAAGGDENSPVVQIYTSGTSGLPKGVVLAHRSFFNVAEAMEDHNLDWLDWRPGDRSLIGLPGFHIGGLSYGMQAFNAGATVVSLPAFISSDAVRVIEEEQVTTAIVAPAMLELMLAEPAAGRGALGSLRKVVYGGSPIGEELLSRAIDVLDCDFLQIYGSSETGNFAVCLPPADHVPGSPLLRAAGRPYPGIEIRVEDPEGKELPTGEVGEICVRTPARMLGYWRLPEATERTVVDGWVHMGDAGYLDEDGYVHVRDRVNDMIIVAGENVYPAEIEDALARHPAVAGAAVVGLPHERWGESVHARVVLEAGQRAGARDLLLFLRGRLADFKMPTSYDFAEALPRNPSGKVLRRAVRDELAAAAKG
ncbi:MULTISPECIES: long-chain-fatty-acid--CoA ligase [Streptomyces]|uniref:long-chain-fatty-acid--CoA ligase n=1 Tax=Streptomyces TaxID=1883 RepID=UPI001E2E3981|nr:MULTISPECIES: long-chain-fatty-acid--CoA ligase [Streptomyces]UFQ13690.1 long-chain-fatty-acid--CoA ligase [Streptomyces huasconensis]WCL83285.1 long-chain-fatty-acid--CoA ligase [Streptomyces sp. JCM 35825]